MRISDTGHDPALATDTLQPAAADAALTTTEAAQIDGLIPLAAQPDSSAQHQQLNWSAAYLRTTIEATPFTQPATGDPAAAVATIPAATTSAAASTPLFVEPSVSPQPAREKSILDMTDAELQNLPAEQKRQLLASFGISEKHLRKTKGGKLDRAFLDVVRALKSPGKHKLTLKLAKKYELKLRVGQDGQLLEAQAKQKKGFFAKLGGILKMAAPILGILLAPVTGGLSLVVSSAIGAVDAIKNKNWLGAIASVAGAFVPGTGSFLSSAVGAAGKTAALAGQTVARVASAVQQGAYAAQAAMMAIRAKSPGALLAAVASGVGVVAGGLGKTTRKLAEMGERLQTWGNIVGSGESVLRAVKSKDYLGAAAGALGTTAGLANGAMSKNLARYAGWMSSAHQVQYGLRTKNYLAAAQGGLGLARDLRQPLGSRREGGEPNRRERTSERIEQALRLVEGASRLQAAVQNKDGAGIAQASLLLGGTVEGVRHKAVLEGGVGGTINGSSTNDTSTLSEQMYRAARMVGWAQQTITAIKHQDYAGAAAAGLGFAAEASENNRYARAERIADRAASLVMALRRGNTAGLQAATAGLMEQVQAEREEARAEQQRLVAQAQQQQQANQPAAMKVVELPRLRPFDAASVQQTLQQLELPTLLRTGAVRPLVDVASLGEPPPLPHTTRITQAAQPPTHPARHESSNTRGGLSSRLAASSTAVPEPRGVRQSTAAEQRRIEHAAVNGASAGRIFSTSVQELGASRWSSQISVVRIGEALYIKAGMRQGLTREQAEAYARQAQPQPHVFDERGQLRPMTASDLDDRRMMARNTTEQGRYRAVVPHDVLAEIREFKQGGAAASQPAAAPAVAAGTTLVLPRPVTLPGAEMARRAAEAVAKAPAATTAAAAGIKGAAAAGVAIAPLGTPVLVGTHYGTKLAEQLAARERARVLPLPPALLMRMEDAEAQPRPGQPQATERPTAERERPAPQVGEWPQEAPGGELVPQGRTGTPQAQPPTAPSTTQPTTPATPPVSQPPQGSAHGTPPSGQPPLDAARGIPTAITTASLGKLASDVFVRGRREAFSQPLLDPLPAGGPRLHSTPQGAPSVSEADELNLYSKSTEEVGRAKQIKPSCRGIATLLAAGVTG